MKQNGRLAEVVDDLWWYALRTPPQKEFAAQEILGNRGVVTFCPADKRWRRRNKYTKTKQLNSYPLMVRYVFAGFVPGVPAWFNLFNLPVIQSCVGIDGKPLRIPGKDMARIIGKYQNGLQQPDDERYMRTHKEFKAGDLVKICDGPFDGMVTPVHSIEGDEARIFIDLFGGQHKARVSTWLLEKAA